MKNLITILTLMVALAVMASNTAVTNTFTLHNPDGTPYVYTAQMTVYPANNNVVVVGTNIIIGGGYTQTLTPNINGQGTNLAEPGEYKIFMPSNNVQFLVNIQTLNPNPDFAYEIVSAPVILTQNSLFAWLTNALGFYPLASNQTAMLNCLQYTPMTNSYTALTNAVHFIPATNVFYTITGAFPYTNGSGGNSTFYITNGIVSTNTTP